MAVTPPISTFFGLDPRFLAAPAASSSLINPLLYGSSLQLVPINFGGFYSGIPPIFGGTGFTGFPTVPFNIFSQPSVLASPFSAGSAFGTGFGTQPFGNNQASSGSNGNFSFDNSPFTPVTGNNLNLFTPSPYTPQSGGSSSAGIANVLSGYFNMMMASMFGRSA
jgi:hypothetical protein